MIDRSTRARTYLRRSGAMDGTSHRGGIGYTVSMMPQTALQHAHHCVYDLHYHCVFVVKYRRALLRPQVEQVEAELARISQEMTA